MKSKRALLTRVARQRRSSTRGRARRAESLSLRKSRQDQASYSIAKGNLFLERGELTGAAALFRQALELDPESARARNNLGLVLARLNDAQGSKREREKAIALDPKLGLAYNALGMIYVQEGQVSEAE